jgi:hypothetical protein
MSEKCLIGGGQNQKWVDASRVAKSLKARQRFSLYAYKIDLDGDGKERRWLSLPIGSLKGCTN